MTQRSFAAIGLALLAFATPAAAQVSTRDRARFADTDRQLAEQFGGTYTGPGVAIVQRVGRQMAIAAGVSRTGQDCKVTVLNSDIVNALALPGCYIYVTRGLLAIMNDEAELASVLGHELGHVAARHAQKRQGRSVLAGIGALAATVLTGSNTVGNFAGQLGQLGVLSYSRGQEYEADKLGAQALVRAGYDPHATADMLDSLARDEQLRARLRGRDANAQAPAFLRSHPLTQDRVRRAEETARATGLKSGERLRNGPAYLEAINGLFYGDDPSQGVVNGREFVHPGLRIAFRAPPGFQLQNTPAAVVLAGPNGEQAQFAGGQLRAGEPIEAYAERVAQSLLGNARAEVGRAASDEVNGIPAAFVPFRANSNRGVLEGTIAAYRVNADSAYYFVAIGPAGGGDRFSRDLLGSFRRLTPAEAASVRGRVVETVAVKAGDSIESLGRQMAFDDLPIERFQALNDLDGRTRLQPGQRVKLVRIARR